jgi:hypothetical protein
MGDELPLVDATALGEGAATVPAGFDDTGMGCGSWMEEASFHNVQVQPLQRSYSSAIRRK